MKNYITIITILLLIACKPNKQVDDNVPVIHINNKNIVKTIKFSELVTVDKYIPLETTEDCLIGHLDKVEMSNDEIFTLDSRKAKAVYRFSKKGKFLNRIARQGVGPGEYLLPYDISMDANTGKIAILDRVKILFYKADNTFLRNLNISVSAYKIAYYDNKIAAYSDRNEDLVLLDENGNQRKAFFKNDYEKKMVMNYPFQLYNGKELLYLANLDYTIHSISGYNVNPHIRFVFDGKMFADNDNKLLKENESNMYNFVRIHYYNENSTHIYMAYFHEKRAYMVIYNKKDSKTSVFDMAGIQNDVTFTYGPPFIVGVDKNDCFVAQFNYSNVSAPDELKKMMGSQADNLDEMSNPILLFFKFK
jgi:hypothetical protein